jgi:hypothetical protein
MRCTEADEVNTPATEEGSARPSDIRFEETAAKSELDFVLDNCPTPNKNQVETMVTGVALLDYDGDGFLDVYFVNGAAIPSLERETGFAASKETSGSQGLHFHE